MGTKFTQSETEYILASSLVNTDIEVEETVKEIEENNKKPYQFGK